MLLHCSLLVKEPLLSFKVNVLLTSFHKLLGAVLYDFLNSQFFINLCLQAILQGRVASQTSAPLLLGVSDLRIPISSSRQPTYRGNLRKKHIGFLRSSCLLARFAALMKLELKTKETSCRALLFEALSSLNPNDTVCAWFFPGANVWLPSASKLEEGRSSNRLKFARSISQCSSGFFRFRPFRGRSLKNVQGASKPPARPARSARF